MRRQATPPAGPGPVKVLVVDLESGPPDLRATQGYATAWVVGRRAGAPVGIVEIDLGPGRLPVTDQLQSLLSVDVAEDSGRCVIPDSELPRISVVVPSVIARLDTLEHCLDSLRQLDYPDFEIVLVDNRVVPPTPDPLVGLAARRPGLRVVTERRKGISAARNAGVNAANGVVVAFTDDDVNVDRGWLRAIGRRFAEEPTLDAVTGLILPAELETPAQIWFERYYGGFSGERLFVPLTLTPSGRGSRLGRRAEVVARDRSHHVVRTLPVYGVGAYGAGANMAFRRRVLLALGGFDLSLGTGTPARGGEDLATLISVLWVGGSIGYEPAAAVSHTHRRAYPDLLRQLQGNGLGFTAMLTALVVHDRSHVLGLGGQLGSAVLRKAGQTLHRLGGRRSVDTAGAVEQSSYPTALVLHELVGMPQGPFAYLCSRREARNWARRHPSATPRGRRGAEI